jgi:hypothetical protein
MPVRGLVGQVRDRVAPGRDLKDQDQDRKVADQVRADRERVRADRDQVDQVRDHEDGDQVRAARDRGQMDEDPDPDQVDRDQDRVDRVDRERDRVDQAATREPRKGERAIPKRVATDRVADRKALRRDRARVVLVRERGVRRGQAQGLGQKRIDRSILGQPAGARKRERPSMVVPRDMATRSGGFGTWSSTPKRCCARSATCERSSEAGPRVTAWRVPDRTTFNRRVPARAHRTATASPARTACALRVNVRRIRPWAVPAPDQDVVQVSSRPDRREVPRGRRPRGPAILIAE